jgi:hypothetical protein
VQAGYKGINDRYIVSSTKITVYRSANLVGGERGIQSVAVFTQNIFQSVNCVLICADFIRPTESLAVPNRGRNPADGVSDLFICSTWESDVNLFEI